MIGVFDSGFGGLTIFESLAARRPDLDYVYLGDHANAPYGSRRPEDILEFTRQGAARLYDMGCRLAVVACNTASAVALHTLQQRWIHHHYPGRNLVGIIVPTIEAATQTPWTIKEPVYPQKYNRQTIAVFGTQRTVDSQAYPVEIHKRCPRVRVFQQACPELAGRIEDAAPRAELLGLIHSYCGELLRQLGGETPDYAILGCTHYPLVKDLFREALPPGVRLLCQPTAVADSFDDYLQRHPEYVGPLSGPPLRRFLTTGDAETVNRRSGFKLSLPVRFETVG
ncbi:MAG TPA: aspartate/glutamate racemase family protein [Azospirillaceae bacterium]|nr:aspartate/glutamate racemase family protein [Azospirillaceae bacterium]